MSGLFVKTPAVPSEHLGQSGSDTPVSPLGTIDAPFSRNNSYASTTAEYTRTDIYSPSISHGANTPALCSTEARSLSQSNRSVTSTSNVNQPMAIVGMACRLPGGVTTPSDLWELCARSRKGWSKCPAGRFNAEAFWHPNPQKLGAFNNRGGYFLDEDVSLFDAPFFQVTEAEAKAMDPQQRLALEVTFEALENAGMPKESLAGEAVGVFAGGSFADYELHNCRDIDTAPPFAATGSAACMLSNRISYYFDFHGPSFTVDTACSSSLTALHQAMVSLRSGESKIAIVAGSHLNILPDYFVTMSTSQLFNEAGESFPFDHRGTSGFARGEGTGVVILKPLDQAIYDNDTIRAVLVNSGVNQDGRTPGITVPNGSAQEALMRSVYASASIDPEDCGFVEAHGTGTKVGDPIEVTALHNVFGQGRTAKKPLYIGSIKANVGHLEGSSGLAAVIKSALMLERGLVLPNVNFEKPNPNVPLAEWNMRVPTSMKPWPCDKKFISVCNYGFGGGNAHAVLERAPRRDVQTLESLNSQSVLERRPDQKWKLFVMSANTKDSLQQKVKQMGIYLEQRPEVFEKRLGGDLAYTLGQRRSHLSWKLAIPATSSDELGVKLASVKYTAIRTTQEPVIGFVCTGQGAQWFGMGRELIHAYPVFSKSLRHADRYLRQLGAEWSLLDELHKDEKSSKIDQAYITQPTCTAIQIALLDLLESWNITPQCTVGHSSGEIAAAYAAGMIDSESALSLAYHRGQATVSLKKQHPELRGKMLAVGSGPDTIMPMIGTLQSGYAAIACINSPNSVTVSGDEAAIDELESLLKGQSIFARALRTGVAYHSKHMTNVAEEYRNAIRHITPRICSKARMHSSLFGRIIHPSELTAEYWVANLVSPVQFCQGVESIFKTDNIKNFAPPDVVIEVGPHPALEGPFKESLKSCSQQAAKFTYTPSLVRKRDANETLLNAVATLYTKGVQINFAQINFPWPDNRTPKLVTDLPKYPWAHEKRYWNVTRVGENHCKRPFAQSDIVGSLSVYSNDLQPTWRKIIHLDDLPWLRQHKMQGLAVYPMAGYLSMAMEAAGQRAKLKGVPFDRFEIREVVSARALILDESSQVEVNTTLRPQSEGTKSDSDAWDEFRIQSWASGKGWVEHCRGLIAVCTTNTGNAISSAHEKIAAHKKFEAEIVSVRTNSTRTVDTPKMYEQLDAAGAGYGPCFQGLGNCIACDTHALAELVVPDTRSVMPKEHETEMIIHPAFFDQFIQIVWPIFGAGRTGLDTLYMPSSIKRVSVDCNTPKATGDKLCVYGNGNPDAKSPRATKFNIWATGLDNTDKVYLRFEDLIMTPILDSNSSGANAARALCYKVEWEPASRTTMGGNQANDTPSQATERKMVDLALVGSVLAHTDLISSLSDHLRPHLSQNLNVETLQTIDAADKICVILVELDGPRLSKLDSHAFAQIQKTLTTAAGILWVVRSAYKDARSPDLSMVTGLARSIRSETMAKFVTLDLDHSSSTTVAAQTIFDVVEATWIKESTMDADMEYTERGGKLFVPRVVRDEQMDNFLHRETQDAAPFGQPFHQPGRRFKLEIAMPGALDTLQFVDDGKDNIPLKNDEIEIEVKATSMNFKDIVIAMGQVPSPYIGVECSGVVSSIGAEVKDLKIGDHVMAMSEGAYSTYARCKYTSAAVIPGGMGFVEASTIPVVFCTAYYGLMDLGKLEANDKVLIHAGAGGVGQAAIMLAKMIGAEIFTTVGSPAKKQFLIDTYGISEDHIFYSRDTSFGPAIRAATRGYGVDVILNSLAGDILRETWECLAHFGRFIEIGKRDILSNSGLGMAMFEHNATFSSIDLTVVAAEKPRLMHRLIKDVNGLMVRKAIQPISPVTTFPISQVQTAFRNLQGGKVMGKVVVVPNPGDEVMAKARKTAADLLSPNKSYLIVGGTGGLGRSVARWMSLKGARNIVLISRSGKVTCEVAQLIEDLGKAGTKVLVAACDVSSAVMVDDLIRRTVPAQEMPGIGGIIYGAMVLRDVLFERMTYEDYNQVVQSKVPGAWNLHNTLEGPSSSARLDFFIALSSVAGAVGNRGQAAYAAANTFLDAFCQYRRNLGLAGTSLALTAVTGVGYLASNDHKDRAAEVLQTLGAETINEAEVLALLAAAITGLVDQTCNSHVMTGLNIQPLTLQDSFWLNDAKFHHLKSAAVALAAAESDTTPGLAEAQLPLAKRLESAACRADAQQIVYTTLTHKLSALLMIPQEDMDPQSPVTAYGLDSLVAIEVRNWIVREAEANLQVLELLSSSSLLALCDAILKKSKLRIKEDVAVTGE